MTRKLNFMKTVAAGRAHSAGARTQRRKLEKLKKKHPAEYAAAMKKLEGLSE